MARSIRKPIHIQHSLNNEARLTFSCSQLSTLCSCQTGELPVVNKILYRCTISVFVSVADTAAVTQCTNFDKQVKYRSRLDIQQSGRRIVDWLRYSHIRELHCIRPYLDLEKSVGLSSPPRPSFTPKLTTVTQFITIYEVRNTSIVVLLSKPPDLVTSCQF